MAPRSSAAAFKATLLDLGAEVVKADAEARKEARRILVVDVFMVDLYFDGWCVVTIPVIAR